MIIKNETIGTMNHIDIDWEGPLPFGYNRKKHESTPPELPDERIKASGVYQIYGDHPIYGRDALFYIGQTIRSNTNRGFSKRIGEHLKSRFGVYRVTSIYIGIVKHVDEDDSDDEGRIIDDPEIIKDAESLLIAAHIPAFNRQHCSGQVILASG